MNDAFYLLLFGAVAALAGFLVGVWSYDWILHRVRASRWGESPAAPIVPASAPATAAATASTPEVETAPQPPVAGAPSEEPPDLAAPKRQQRDPEYSEEQLDQTSDYLRRLYGEAGIVLDEAELRREAALHLDGSSV